MSGVILSFVGLVGLVVGLELAAGLTRKLRGKPFAKAGGFAKGTAISVLLTVAITLLVTLLLQWTGFAEAQFYRPSDRNFRQHAELGLQYENVWFDSGDGTRLFGWFLAAPGEPLGTVIHLHGSDQNISSTVRNSYWLIERGFNLFVFDYRGYARSEGEPSRQGVVEDAVAAIEHVRSRPDVDADRLLLWGQSLGGQLAIVAARQAGTHGIRAVVAEATYASYRDHIQDKLAQMGPLWLVQWAIWLLTSDELAAEGVVGDLSPTPVLIVHGSDDTGVLPEHGERLFEAAREPKEIWRVAGAGHLDIFGMERQRERLVAYLRGALGVVPDAAVAPADVGLAAGAPPMPLRHGGKEVE